MEGETEREEGRGEGKRMKEEKGVGRGRVTTKVDSSCWRRLQRWCCCSGRG